MLLEASRCGAGAAVDDGAPRRAAVAADRTSAAGCGEHSVDPPEKVHRRAVAGQPLVGTAEADPCFCSQFSQGTTVLEVLIDEPEPALLCQPGIGMAMHGA